MTMNARFCRVLFSEFSLLSVTIFAITLVARKAIDPLCVCVSVTMVERNHLSAACAYLAQRFNLTMYASSLKVKIIGQSPRWQKEYVLFDHVWTS